MNVMIRKAVIMSLTARLTVIIQTSLLFAVAPRVHDSLINFQGRAGTGSVRAAQTAFKKSEFLKIE